MAQVAPTITAYDTHEYRTQMERVANFATRVHIDLMDGQFAPTRSPGLEHVWWPHGVKADIHLMYQLPATAMAKLIELKPHLVVIHAEAKVDHSLFAAHLHKAGIKAGLALLADTPVEKAEKYLYSFDHVLIFSGKLGYHGGKADLLLLEKVKAIRSLHHEAEIGWDGGITNRNAPLLVELGVDVLNVGGFIMNDPDPETAYVKIREVIGHKNGKTT